MTGGSQQLRRFRIAVRAGTTWEEAAGIAGIALGEAKLIYAEDAKNPPPEEAYVLLGEPVREPEQFDPSWPFGDLVPLRYRVILADPPWRFRTWGEHNQHKSASKHYPLMRTEDIAALPVNQLAAPDCMLMMWAVQSMIPQALELMSAWGFTYKTMGAWAKQSSTGEKWAFGTGYLLRCAAEFFIVGTIGKPAPLARNVRNLIVAPNREHSRKPDEMHENLERMFPNDAKCELFARTSRPGWSVWGNQTDRFARDA